MSDTPNKVKFGLKNVHYAMLTIDENGDYSFDTPAPIPGAVNLSLDVNGEPEIFYADDIAYYVVNNNMGYSGDLEIALIPEGFRVAALSEEADSNDVLIEKADAELNSFALLFEFTGDKKKVRHVLYNCSASRPKIEGNTVEDNKTPQTETLTLNAVPLPDGIVKAKTGNNTDSTTYDEWYTSVYIPTP